MSTQPTLSRENKDQEGAPGAKRRPTRRAQRTQRPAGGGRPEPASPRPGSRAGSRPGPGCGRRLTGRPCASIRCFLRFPRSTAARRRGDLSSTPTTRGGSAPLLSPAHRPVSVPCHGADVAETPPVVAGGFHANQGHCRLPSSGRCWRAPNPAPGSQPVTG